MAQTIRISGVPYKFEDMGSEIHLSKYSEKYKIQLDIYAPKATGEESKKKEAEITEALSKLYIERHAGEEYGLNG